MPRLLGSRLRPLLALGAGGLLLATLVTGNGGASTAAQPSRVDPVAAQPAAADALIPKPVSVQDLPGAPFRLTRDTAIGVDGGPRADRVGAFLADLLRGSTGFPIPVGDEGDITLEQGGVDAGLGSEGYLLDVTADGVTVRANRPDGLYRGVTTLRQLLPEKVEYETVQPGPWTVDAIAVEDWPRFGYRGVMLDVSRHFFSVGEVKRYIDLATMYKVNRLHLHLSDDQGWRIVIDSWPRLATYGGSTEVGGGRGGYYTKAQYAEIVRYAAERFMTVVPEIDTPSHTNAALASYAKLNCDGVAPPLYTGTEVGFSSLCVPKPVTYRFLDDVFGELAAMTPGDVMHMGGDEAHVTPHEQYLEFVPKAAAIVNDHGKDVMGWQEIAETDIPPNTTTQYWGTGDDRSAELARMAVAKGATIVMSPANRAYLDMKYNENTPYGLSWAGLVPVRRSYGWDPATQVDGVPESAIAGVEAPLWSETLDEIAKAEFMAYPRLAGIAEIGWTPRADRSWSDYRDRLGAQAPRWNVLDVNFFRSPQVDWADE
jgi:hexosaminidase